MIVYLHQYRTYRADEEFKSEDDSDADAQIDTGEGGDPANQDSEEYFNKDELGPEEEWEKVSYGDRFLERRPLTYENVTRVSVPRDVEEPSDTPGETIQLNIDAETMYVEDAVLIELTDEDPER